MTPEWNWDSEEQAESLKSLNRRTLARLAGCISGHPLVFWSAVGLILVGTAAMLAAPRLFGYAIDEAIIPKDRELLMRIGVLFLLVECIRVAAVIGHSYLFELLGQRVMQDLRVRLFAHLQVLPVSIYDRNPVGRLVTRVTNDVAAMAEMFSAGFVAMIGNLLYVLGILAWLLALDLELGLVTAAVLPVLALVSVKFSSMLQSAYRISRSRLSALNAFLAENILGIRVVHLFNRGRLHRERFQRINDSYADAQMSSVRVFAFLQPAITWSTGIAMALLVWHGGLTTVEGRIPLGVLVAFFTYALSMFQPIREIADKWSVFLSGMTAAERVFSILDWKPEMALEETTHSIEPLEGITGEIRFENVWFAYDEEHWVLRDFSLVIRPGAKVGIVGHTGAGKTTIISLLMRFYEPQRGRILLDGRDIRELDKRRLRAAIGIIQQDVFLFSGSIAENISLWRSGLEPVRPALERMGFSRWLEPGQSELQERGSNLSMGERQVMAYARALATRPSIWILDEATANIDSRTEELLGESLEEASRGRTTLLIAHRLATVRSADLIVVMHKGALVESGSHRELMALDGAYARLYRYQSAGGDQLSSQSV